MDYRERFQVIGNRYTVKRQFVEQRHQAGRQGPGVAAAHDIRVLFQDLDAAGSGSLSFQYSGMLDNPLGLPMASNLLFKVIGKVIGIFIPFKKTAVI